MNFPEIICLNETKLPSKINFSIQGYNCVARRESNPNGGSRGSLILTRTDIKNVEEIEEVKLRFKHDEIVGIKIHQTHSRPALNIFTYYNPPLCTPNFQILHYLGSFSEKTVLTGDLNCKHVCWGSNTSDSRGKELLDQISANDLVFFNDLSKTRCDPSTGKEESLDLIIGNCESCTIFQEFWVGLDVGSDHYPLHLTLQFDIPRKSDILVRKEQKLNKTKFIKMLNEYPCLSAAKTPAELDANANQLISEITESFESSCPLTKIKNRQKCRFTPEMEAKVKEKRKLRREKNAALASDDMSRARIIMTRINRLGNEIKRMQKEEKKRAFEIHCHKLNRHNSPKEFFKTFKLISEPIVSNHSSTNTSRPIEDENGNVASTSSEKTNLFAERLQGIHQEPDFAGFDESWKNSVELFLETNKKCFTYHRDDTFEDPEFDDESPLCSPVTIDEFDSNLAKCKNGSAAGPDGITYSLIKKLPTEYKKKVCSVFSDAVRLGHYPSLWKDAIVKMIPKPNKDAKYAKNFRPISLLSCMGKVLERIIARRLSEYMEVNNMFTTSQSGFRKHRMTTEQLLRLSEEAHIAFKKQQVVSAIFLDAEAAFDRCWHQGIKYKLKKNLNLPDRFIRLISSFLSDRTLTVVYEGCHSKKVYLKAGTPQGSPLSPLIYLIFVNDFPEEIKSTCSLSQFADDTALWTAAYTHSYATRKLQKGLDSLEGWCRRWRVKLNGDKSKLLFFSRNNSEPDENYYIQLFNDIVKPSKQAKFLGVHLDEKLSFKDHFETIQTLTIKRLNVLRLLARNSVEPNILMRLYKIYIRPIMEYGSFSFIAAPKTHFSKLQKIQNEALRVCLRLPGYIQIGLLHECASIETFNERLLNLNQRLLGKMFRHNIDIKNLVESYFEEDSLQSASPISTVRPTPELFN